ncbi:hypothetical protein H5410_024995 [Solanum commersonii]|uniref:Uncharacterized protein n=1 Tax=Solanum commersonii TaxID=4109 RepID=A0A9J5YUN3_SOLCO|nr:hypothetical protein H5410_024995 [Solanum commersonii]
MELDRIWNDVQISLDHIYKANSDHFNISSLPFNHNPVFSFPISKLLYLLVYALFLALFFFCAVATITYSSVTQVCHDRSITFISSIKSIRNSFFPLLSTFIISHTIFISISLIFALVLLLLSQILQSLGLIELKSDSNHLLFLVTFAFIVVLPILLWLQVNWSLAYVIAVVESKSGFETLRRSSAYLVKEKRSVGFRIHLNFGLMVGGMVIGSNVFIASTMLYGLVKSGWWSIPMVMGTMMWWILASSGMRELLMKNVLLYMYCNDFNGGKLTLEEIGGKFGDVFVYFPLVDEKNHGIV